MSDCEHEWIGSENRSIPLDKWRACRKCGVVEKAVELERFCKMLDPPLLTWTTKKPNKKGWYWYRSNALDAFPVVIAVSPDLDIVGPWPDGSEERLSTQDGEWAGPLEMPK